MNDEFNLVQLSRFLRLKKNFDWRAKKSSRRRYTWFKRYYSIKRLFNIVTNWCYSRRSKLFLHYRHELRCFFYQWRVYSFDQHKLTMINYKKQKFFNVIVMSYKNFFVYVQKQINQFLKLHRVYVKTYINIDWSFQDVKIVFLNESSLKVEIKTRKLYYN